jgi:hypothetical protein
LVCTWKLAGWFSLCASVWKGLPLFPCEIRTLQLGDFEIYQVATNWVRYCLAPSPCAIFLAMMTANLLATNVNLELDEISRIEQIELDDRARTICAVMLIPSWSVWTEGTSNLTRSSKSTPTSKSIPSGSRCREVRRVASSSQSSWPVATVD